jgi:hypothetical protein
MTQDPGILDVLRFFYHAPAAIRRMLTADRTAFVILCVIAFAAVTRMVGASADRQQRGKKG